MIQTFIHKQFVFFQVENKNFSAWGLEKHQIINIKDFHINGELTVIWRDWAVSFDDYDWNKRNVVGNY